MDRYTQTVLAENPLFYYRLNETTTAQFSPVSDSSGNNNNAEYWTGCTSANGILYSTSNKGIFFDFSNNGAVHNGPLIISPASTVTIELWAVRTSVAGTLGMTFSQGSLPSSGNTGAYCYWGGQFGVTQRTVVFSAHGNAADANVAIWVDAIPAGPNGTGINTIVHQVITFNAVTQTAELFINGVSQGTRTGLGPPGPSDQGSFRLAHWWSGNQILYHWRGVLDEVAGYNTILSADTIRRHYELGRKAGDFFEFF